VSIVVVDSLSISYDPSTRRRRPTEELSSLNLAVRHVSFSLSQGHILGLVGESGSGKSSVARCVAGYQRPTFGSVTLDGVDLAEPSARSERRRIQMVFQDPYSSLNPSMTLRQAIREPIAVHRLRPKSAIDARVSELAALVGLDERLLDERPRQLSGGQRQRASIARALALEPDVLVADEPVSALDVSVQAVVLNLLANLREELGMSILFISHDMAVVSHLCDDVVVMAAGNVVEAGPTTQVFESPRHAYTQELLAAVPPHPWA
jgi:ABC-type glutathione transport system ATPase component